MQKSESIINLAKALALFQSEVKNPANTANNPFFKSKYAPLPDILNDVRPLLSKHGLSVLQSPSGDGDKIIITTMLMHSSGEWIETCPLILRADKATAQGAGSAITYGRRYALSSILGISSEDDDDGNSASGNKNGSNDNKNKQNNGSNTQQSNKQSTGNENPNAISEGQIKKLHVLRGQKNITEDDFKKQLTVILKRDIASLKDLTKKEASDIIERIEKAK